MESKKPKYNYGAILKHWDGYKSSNFNKRLLVLDH